MARVEFHVLRHARAVSELRAAQLRERMQARPALVVAIEPGPGAQELFARCAEQDWDLSRLRVRYACGLLRSDARGYRSAAHPGSTAWFAQQRMLAVSKPGLRPLDWVLLPEFLVSCEEVDAALARTPAGWSTSASFLALDPEASGPLGLLRRSCQAFDELLDREPPELLCYELSAAPDPSLALISDAGTSAELGTHLVRLGSAARQARAADFAGDVEAVPPYGLTVGPRLFRAETELWITALGPGRAEPLAACFGETGSEDFGPVVARGLACSQVSVACDTSAAEELLEAEGRRGLIERFARAGHELILHEADD